MSNLSKFEESTPPGQSPPQTLETLREARLRRFEQSPALPIAGGSGSNASRLPQTSSVPQHSQHAIKKNAQELEKFRQRWQKEIEYKRQYRSESDILMDEVAREKRLQRQRNFVTNGSLSLSPDEIKKREDLASTRRAQDVEETLAEARKTLLELENQVKPWLPGLSVSQRYALDQEAGTSPAQLDSNSEQMGESTGLLQSAKLERALGGAMDAQRRSATSEALQLNEIVGNIIDHMEDTEVICACQVSWQWYLEALRGLKDPRRQIHRYWLRVPSCSSIRDELVDSFVDDEEGLFWRIVSNSYGIDKCLAWACNLNDCNFRLNTKMSPQNSKTTALIEGTSNLRLHEEISPGDADDPVGLDHIPSLTTIVTPSIVKLKPLESLTHCTNCSDVCNYFGFRAQKSNYRLETVRINPILGSHVLAESWSMEDKYCYINLVPTDPPTCTRPSARNKTGSWRNLFVTYPPVKQISIYGFDSFHWDGAEIGSSKNHTRLELLENPNGIRAGELVEAVERHGVEVRDKWRRSKDKEYGRESRLIEDREVDKLWKLLPRSPAILLQLGNTFLCRDR